MTLGKNGGGGGGQMPPVLPPGYAPVLSEIGNQPSLEIIAEIRKSMYDFEILYAKTTGNASIDYSQVISLLMASPWTSRTWKRPIVSSLETTVTTWCWYLYDDLNIT